MHSSDDIHQLIIHGLGVEGRAALDWFLQTGISKITIVDTKERLQSLTARHNSNSRVDYVPEDQLELPATGTKNVLYLRSPGVSPANHVFKAVERNLIQHTTPTGYWLSTLAPQDSVTITGTKGKSTTASLVAHILRWAGKNAEEMGNIGRPPFEATIEPDTICVLELSSYMMHDLPPTGHYHAVINLYKEHTDWHGTHDAYRRDKLRPYFQDQPSPGIVPKALAPEVESSKGRIDYFEDFGKVENGALTLSGADLIIAAGDLNDLFTSPSMIEALRAAAAICLSAGLLTPRQIADALQDHLASWPGLPSRQSIIPSADGLIWVDDTLATVPEATLSALARWSGNKIHLLLGGDNRGQDFSALIAECASNADIRIYAFSKTAAEIAAQATAAAMNDRCQLFETLENAVLAAQKQAQTGDVILFSPAAPSAPPHANYTERSAIFQSFVPRH